MTRPARPAPALPLCFFLAAGLAMAPARAAAGPLPPDPPPLVETDGILLGSLALPAWGAYKAEAPLLAATQLLVDVVAVAALLAPQRPDAGAGLAPLIGLGALAANRAVGAPLNLHWARRENARRLRAAGVDGAPPAPPWRGHFFLGAGGYRLDGVVSAGLAFEAGRLGLKAYRGLGEADRTLHIDGPDAGGVITERSFGEEGIWGVTAYGRLPLSRRLELQPGLHWTRSDYTYREWRHPFGSPEDLGGSESDHPRSQWLMPCVSLGWRPTGRLHGSLGAGYAAVIPQHVLDFDDGQPDWAKRLGLHAQVGFGIF